MNPIHIYNITQATRRLMKEDFEATDSEKLVLWRLFFWVAVGIVVISLLVRG